MLAVKIMRSKLILISIAILPHLGFSQYKVIISKNNTFKFGDCILINAPLTGPGSGVVSLRSILIVNKNGIIPIDSTIKAWRIPYGFSIDSIVVANRVKQNSGSDNKNEYDSDGYILFGNNTTCEIGKIDDIDDDLFRYKQIATKTRYPF